MILKGATLFTLWTDEFHRPTRDLDLLGHGENDTAAITQSMREIAAIKAQDDGLIFDIQSATGERIREEQEYEGVRVRMMCRLGNAKIPIQIDIGFGDIVVPMFEVNTLPTIIDLPPPVLRTYNRETVIAEKLQAMVALGMTNSRIKDFHDVWYLSSRFDFDADKLSQAVLATFERRKTPIPEQPPLALTETFYRDKAKQAQWRAFWRRMPQLASPVDFADAIDQIGRFLLPMIKAAKKGFAPTGRWSCLARSWQDLPD